MAAVDLLNRTFPVLRNTIKLGKQQLVQSVKKKVAVAAAQNDANELHACVRKLKGWTPAPAPVAQLAGGTAAPTPLRDRGRWQEHFARDIFKGEAVLLPG